MPRDLFVVGLSWRTAPVSLREKLAFSDDEIPCMLDELLGSSTIDEGVIVSTCNRVEIYGATPFPPSATVAAAAAEAREFLVRCRGVSSDSVSGKLYERTELDAVRHLFRVASALDSMVVGESQILGQVKQAYGAARRAESAGSTVNKCMQHAFSVAKRVRSETGISRGAANVSSVAVELASRVFGDLSGKSVLVVGAGKMSVLAARHLRANGAGAIHVTNRSSERAAALAREVDGVARPWSDLRNLLAASDVVISSTGAVEPVLTKKLVKPAMKMRRYKPIVIVDIAVPRDAQPAIAKLDGVYLFDIDDLERVVAENVKERTREADAAELIIDSELGIFEEWHRAQTVVPTIRNLRKHFSSVAGAEADKVIRSLESEDSPQERERIIRRLGDLIVNKLLHTPMSTLKRAEDLDLVLEVTQRLFGLPSDEAEQPAQEPGGELQDGGDSGERRGSA